MKKSFNIQELLHCKFKRHWTKPMHTSLLRAFQRHQEHNLKHPCLVDLITTKQTTFLMKIWIVRFLNKISFAQIECFHNEPFLNNRMFSFAQIAQISLWKHCVLYWVYVKFNTKFEELQYEKIINTFEIDESIWCSSTFHY